MNAIKYIYWQDENMWLGYLEEFPDYWTQGETMAELEENLRDVHQELTRKYPLRPKACRTGNGMKRTDLMRELEKMGCVLVRHGAKHDWYHRTRGRKYPSPFLVTGKLRSLWRDIFSKC